MLTISPISTNFYTNNNCRKPCFKAGMSNEALYDSMAMLTKELEPKLKNVTATKKTKRPLFQWFLNIFKSHKTNNISEFSKIDSPIGKLELSPEGVKQYAEVATLYAEGYTWRNELYSAETKVIKSKLMMEVLGSLGEFSTNYNDVIKSKTFGKIKVTEEGLKQYLDTIDLYAEGFPARKKSYSDETKVIKSKLMMEVLGSLGEFSTNYNDVIKSKTFGEIKVTEEGLKQYLDAIKLYAEGFPARNKCYNDKQRVIEAEQIINIIKGNGEY